MIIFKEQKGYWGGVGWGGRAIKVLKETWRKHNKLKSLRAVSNQRPGEETIWECNILFAIITALLLRIFLFDTFPKIISGPCKDGSSCLITRRQYTICNSVTSNMPLHSMLQSYSPLKYNDFMLFHLTIIILVRGKRKLSDLTLGQDNNSHIKLLPALPHQLPQIIKSRAHQATDWQK